MQKSESTGEDHGPGFLIGYAFRESKQRSFLNESLLERAEAVGIHFIAVDLQRPLDTQGPFHVILHKLSSSSWDEELADYVVSHPDVLVVDHPQFVNRLRDRISMLQVVIELQNNLSSFPGSCDLSVRVPTYCVLHGEESEEDRLSLLNRLHFPVIAKPLTVDGSATSHALSLVFSIRSLANVKAPLVVQEFISHGGVIFKVYVAGDFVECVCRKSLPDACKDQYLSEPISFCQISNTSISLSADPDLQGIELPPSGFIANIASGLRKVLSLRLFNFDIIKDVRTSEYYIIDINYFPGYEKLPDFETFMIEFFLSLKKGQGIII
ncbi:hypothetical protein KP509_19G031200 [Ceratopteris richardii]|uniref:Inositol-tetrakisphosphate 1-kinase n=1 Tax=Ceratopteris richardii TaxID=49495 RepID=A0A8T2SN52_CERRI|nr:hypothetical protein KP509_19G031200 [Ceratopteris richardii]